MDGPFTAGRVLDPGFLPRLRPQGVASVAWPGTPVLDPENLQKGFGRGGDLDQNCDWDEMGPRSLNDLKTFAASQTANPLPNREPAFWDGTLPRVQSYT